MQVIMVIDCIFSKVNHETFSLCRRYIAMIDLCCMAGNRDQLITLLLQVAECAITILLVHFHDE